MQKRYGYVVGFIISVFFAISFLMTASASLLDPALTIEFIETHPLFSLMGPIMGYCVHIFGNMFFAAVAIFSALVCWRKYNS